MPECVRKLFKTFVLKKKKIFNQTSPTPVGINTIFYAYRVCTRRITKLHFKTKNVFTNVFLVRHIRALRRQIMTNTVGPTGTPNNDCTAVRIKPV